MLDLNTSYLSRKERFIAMNRKLIKGNWGVEVILCITALLICIVLNAWCSDDAYHAYIMVKNLLKGNGFTPTVGIRVNVSTCPLWTLIVAFADIIIGNVYISGMILNIFFSMLSISILIYVCKGDFLKCLLVTLILINSDSFISFTTSGLENSLLFFLTVLFYIYLKKFQYDTKGFFAIAFIEGLIAFTRMDAVLVFAPACLYVYCSKISSIRSFFKRCIIAVCGLSPFIIWEIFSFIYYGSLFPNTMLAKLNTEYAASEYIKRGISYLGQSFLFDPLVILCPICLVIFTINKYKNVKKNEEKNKLFITISGIVLYFLYIIYIGGDFMLGRHFTLIFFLSIFIFMDTLFCNNSDHSKCSRILVVIMICSVLIKMFAFRVDMEFEYYCGDERAVYIPYTGLVEVVEDYIEDKDVEIIGKCPHRGIQWFYGNESFLWGEEVINSYEERLYDPLLVRLPAIRTEDWTIGHMEREFPEGYQETLDTGENYIKNVSLKEYYDKLRIILSGDVFTRKRIETLIEFKRGNYDYLLEDYRVNELGY